MRVLYIHRTKGSGVEGVHIRGIVEAFRTLGHEVDILSPAGWEREGEGKGRSRGAGGGSRLHEFVSRHAPEFLFEVLELLYNLKVLALLRREPGDRHDFVYERYAFFAFAGARHAASRRMPFAAEVNYLTTTPLVRKRTRLLAPLAGFLERQVLRTASCVAAVSSPLRDSVIAAGIPREVVVVTPNAADPEKLDPARFDGEKVRSRLGIDPRETVVGFVGGFYPWHGIPFLIESLLPVMREVKTIRLLLLGDGPEKGRAADLASRLHDSHRIRFCDSVPHAELPHWLAAMDVGVMPDSNDYGSPMKVFEYMAMGIPVVAPDLPPLRDVIRDGEDGFLFRRGDGDGIARVVRRLAEDGEERKRVGERARETLVARHTWERNVEKVLAAAAGGANPA